MTKIYLGDGVYLAQGSHLGEFVLTTENGVRITNTIVIDHQMIDAMVQYKTRAFHDEQLRGTSPRNT